jgi:hypothetical protein
MTSSEDAFISFFVPDEKTAFVTALKNGSMPPVTCEFNPDNR